MRFASALSQHPAAAHAVGETAGSIIDQLDGDEPDLVVCFASPQFAGAFDDMVHALRELLEPVRLLGATTVSVIGDAREIEEGPALSVFAASLPDATLVPVALSVAETPDGAAVVGWPDDRGAASTLLLCADPFTFPVDAFLRRLDVDIPGLTVIGGLASAADRPGGNRLALDERVTETGAVGVLMDGVDVDTVVSQGCRPIGQPFVVTRAERNFVEELGGRPALQRLEELANAASEDDRELLRRGLHVGVVVDEHRADFGRGDFLVRNVLGADRESGAIAIGEHVTVGQTVQFHVRDAAAADEDLRELLGGASARGALLFTCNGRGQRLFGTPHHDASLLESVLGPIPASGGFCAGEIGPVGGRNFLHGFTASLALFR